MAKKFNLTQIQDATKKNPGTMLMFSYPKVGKTELFTKLDSHFIVDFDETGTDYYKAVKAKIRNLEDLDDLVEQFIKEKPHFSVIVLDTITTLYSDICGQLAVRIYNEENGKKKPLTWDIKRLDYGKGYSYLREALQKVIEFFKDYCDTLILSGHVADKALSGDNNTSVKDVDLEGKLKNIISVKVDAVGLLYRKEPSKNYLSFISSEELIGGTRSQHLANKEFLISEKDEDNNLVTYWDKILLKD